MSSLAIVTQRLAAITMQLNAIVANAKKIDELTVQETLNLSSKFHVSNSGFSESLSVQKIIDYVIVANENTITPYTSFKFVHKGFGNVNLNEYEEGDIFCGWSNDGTIRISEAKWIGGSLTDSNNFNPIVQTEI